MKLTNSTITKIEPPGSGYALHWDSDLKGFGLRVTTKGAKAFIAQAKVSGKARRITLGRFGALTAEQARKKARAVLGEMAGGVDPAVEKRRGKALSVTLSAVTEAYLTNRRTRAGLPLKDRTKADIRYHLRTSFPAWRDKPVARITREMIQRRYNEITGRSVAQANQAFRVLRAIVSYAAASYRTPEGERIIADNPVDVLRETNMLRSVKPKSNMVPLERLGEWWSAVKAMRGDPALTTASRSAADLIALLALTGLRLGEARSIRWAQVDLVEGSLTLTDTKNRSDVILPLSRCAAEIIKNRPEGGSYIFPSRSKAGKLAYLKDCRAQLNVLAERTGITITAHDLRRTFRAIAAEVGLELWRTKALMNHKQNDDITLSHYADLSDVRNLKPDANRVAEYIEKKSKAFEPCETNLVAKRSLICDQI